jgi:hypothetical protein
MAPPAGPPNALASEVASASDKYASTSVSAAPRHLVVWAIRPSVEPSRRSAMRASPVASSSSRAPLGRPSRLTNTAWRAATEAEKSACAASATLKRRLTSVTLRRDLPSENRK